MPKITFIDHAGGTRVVDIAVGRSLMEGARDAGIAAIYADCGGSCACATCHVHIDPDWLAKLTPAGDMEQEMLEFAAAPTDASSRLSCQVVIGAEHDGMQVRTPETQA